jgi:hypothetical protein
VRGDLVRDGSEDPPPHFPVAGTFRSDGSEEPATTNPALRFVTARV